METLVRAGHVNVIRTCCTSGLVLDNGRATFFPDVADAVARHRRKLRE